jgi:transposase
MLSAKKTSRRERSEREIATILVLHVKGYSTRRIDDEINISKLTVTRIIRRAINSLNK